MLTDDRHSSGDDAHEGAFGEAGDVTAAPFLKWAGGKRAIASQIASLLPADARDRVYREPFVGGGAMYYHLRPRRAYLSDALGDLVTTYHAVQRDAEALIARLEVLRATHSADQYYAVRDRFNRERGAGGVARAAWLLYLNKTCFNGLFRTNRQGAFNVPVGRHQNPSIVDPPALRAASAALQGTVVRHLDYAHLLDEAEPGDLIYLDPPYVPTSKTSSFTAYAGGGFSARDQERLADVYRQLDARGCLLALSNSDTPLVRRLYEGYDLAPIVAPRSCGASGAARGAVTELLVRNVARYPRGGSV